MNSATLLRRYLGKLRLLGFIFVWFGILSPFWSCHTAIATEAKRASDDAELQARVAELLQKVLGDYRDENMLPLGSTNNPSATYTNIESNFREASLLMPNRLDLRFGIASALVGQALQTNAPFDSKMKAALKIYQEINRLDPNGFQSLIQYAAYTRALGETNESEGTIAQLMTVHPKRARDYLKKFLRIEKILQITPNLSTPEMAVPKNGHAIVVLGAAFATNGTMKAKLIDRLNQGLILARSYPEASIIVTGGNAMNGITEAYAMSLWFLQRGISTNRLFLEDHARDTVGNALWSCRLLEKLGVTQVTLVTSASHLRRALADFEEAALQRGLTLQFTHLASRDEPIIDEARERIAIYRDVMRTSGIWAFPGIQR